MKEKELKEYLFNKYYSNYLIDSFLEGSFLLNVSDLN